jgi:hypothetical protein
VAACDTVVPLWVSVCMHNVPASAVFCALIVCAPLYVFLCGLCCVCRACLPVARLVVAAWHVRDIPLPSGQQRHLHLHTAKALICSRRHCARSTHVPSTTSACREPRRTVNALVATVCAQWHACMSPQTGQSRVLVRVPSLHSVHRTLESSRSRGACVQL